MTLGYVVEECVPLTWREPALLGFHIRLELIKFFHENLCDSKSSSVSFDGVETLMIKIEMRLMTRK
jgi:hypothetical protein